MGYQQDRFGDQTLRHQKTRAPPKAIPGVFQFPAWTFFHLLGSNLTKLKN